MPLPFVNIVHHFWHPEKKNLSLARQEHSMRATLPLSLSQRKDFFYLPPAFESSTKASNAKGTLLIHQRGDTEGCSGSLDRQRLKSERQRRGRESEEREAEKGSDWVI